MPRRMKSINTELFTDEESFTAALASFNAMSERRGVNECWPWLGTSVTTMRAERKLAIFQFGQFYAMNMQRFAFIAHHNLNAEIKERGSREVAAITATCSSEMCANPNHIVERETRQSTRQLSRRQLTRR
jgi:uncharacterized protein YktB (UPF0637 family)